MKTNRSGTTRYRLNCSAWPIQLIAEKLGLRCRGSSNSVLENNGGVVVAYRTSISFFQVLDAFPKVKKKALAFAIPV